MEKKHIVISVGLIVFMLIVVIVYNVTVKRRNSGDDNGSDIDTSKVVVPSIKNGDIVCARTKKGNNETITFTLNNDSLTKSKFAFVELISNYGFNDSNITEDNKMEIRTEIIKKLKLDSLDNTGIDLALNYNKEYVEIIVTIDYSKADELTVKQLGANFERKSFKDTIKKLVASGEYTCN